MTQILITLVHVIFSLGLIINGLLFIPQIIKLWRQKHAQDVSLLTFAGFSTLQIFTGLHGYLIADYILMWGMAFSLLCCGSVTILIIYYRLNSKGNI